MICLLMLAVSSLQIDYLVNNAGRSQRSEAIATELAVDRALFDLNVLSTFSLTKAVLPEMIEHKEGCVVVISSVAGKIGKSAVVCLPLAQTHHSPL
jgi:dehydrogenase/reductase SDR family protein 7